MKRLFCFDETDTVIAVSENAARKFYQDIAGLSDEEMAGVEVVEVPKEEWPKRTVITDEFEDEQIKIPLDKWTEQFDENKPEIVCSTEC